MCVAVVGWLLTLVSVALPFQGCVWSPHRMSQSEAVTKVSLVTTQEVTRPQTFLVAFLEKQAQWHTGGDRWRQEEESHA